MCRKDLVGFMGREGLTAFFEDDRVIDALYKYFKDSSSQLHYSIIYRIVCNFGQIGSEIEFKKNLKTRGLEVVDAICELGELPNGESPILGLYVIKQLSEQIEQMSPDTVERLARTMVYTYQ